MTLFEELTNGRKYRWQGFLVSAGWLAVWQEKGRECYVSETVDWIGFCGRAGIQRHGGRDCG
jgi:hypothetical protein